MAAKPKVTVDRVKRLQQALYFLARREVLVGYPEQGSDDANGDAVQARNEGDITNAALAYIHDNGAPESGIPARPFMQPAVQAIRGQVTDMMMHVADQVAKGADEEFVDRSLHQIGGTVVSSVKQTINDGVPPPLADATVRARAKRGRKGAKQELENRSKGLPAGTDLAKPLVDTGQLRNAATYVIRNTNEREE